MFLVLIVSCATSILCVIPLLALLRRVGLEDLPNDRSSHAVPTPRGGGIALLAGLGAGLGTLAIIGWPPPLASVAGITALFAAIGLADDLRSIPALARLALQVLAAVAGAAWLLLASAFRAAC